MIVTKHLVLKIENFKTQPHNDTKIRIKLPGSERCPMSSVDSSPAVQKLTFVEEGGGKETESLPVTGGSYVTRLMYRIGAGAALGEPPAAEHPPDALSSLCRCLQTDGTRGCPNCRRLSVKPGYV